MSDKKDKGPLTAEERREQAAEEGSKMDVAGQGTPTQEAPGDFEKAPTTEEQRAKGEALQRKMDKEAAESDEPQAPPPPNLTIPIPESYPENPPQPPPPERLSDEDLEEQAFFTDHDATEEEKVS